MNEEVEDLSEEAYKMFLWPEDDFIEAEQLSFDDWLFSLTNSYGG